MFQRVITEEWAHLTPFLSFFLFAAVFLAVSIRAIRIDKAERERMAALPLEPDTTSPESPHRP
jgi:hypothetical protein